MKKQMFKQLLYVWSVRGVSAGHHPRRGKSEEPALGSWNDVPWTVDAVHVASAMEMSCDEFLSFDQRLHRNKVKLDAVAVCVKLPSNSVGLLQSQRS